MLDVRHTAARCEGLGRNCEFGLVQRNLGLEPLSLLRWSGAKLRGVDGLIDGLREKFTGLAEDMEGAIIPPDGPPDHRHWWLTCRRYGLEFHTELRPVQFTVEAATARIRPRLRRLAEKLLEDISLGEKLFVYSSAEFTDPLDGLPLIDAFRQAGGTGPLLIVASGMYRAIDQIDHNTFGATLPKLTPRGQAVALDQAAWEALLIECAGIVSEPVQMVEPVDQRLPT